MTEKVKLTQEQAETIGNLKKNGFTDESIIESHAKLPNGWMLVENAALNRMPLLKLVDALRIGYEVEPQFKVGDWVVSKSDSENRIKVVKTVNGDGITACGNSSCVATHFSNFRHATPEEIKAEQERQMWKKIGREVGEFKERDTGFDFDGHLVPGYTALNETYKNGSLQGFYPSESFISFEEVKS